MGNIRKKETIFKEMMPLPDLGGQGIKPLVYLTERKHGEL
jgi:hypothetical protein